MRLLLIAITAMLLQGCCLFGRTTVVHDRMPFIAFPQEPPQLQPDDGTVERWQENFSEVATFAIRMYRGIAVYNEIALKHNLEHGYVKEDEVEEIRRMHRMPPPPPDKEPTPKEEASPGQ